MNICLLGLSGSGKTCYLYVMSNLLGTGIYVGEHRISARCTNRQQQVILDQGSQLMVQGNWPNGSVETITYPFKLYIDGKQKCDFNIYDYRGGALDGTEDADTDDSNELFNTFTDSSCIVIFIDGVTLLSALEPGQLETEHRNNFSYDSQLSAQNKINYIESLMLECSNRLERKVPILLVITKKDILSEGELAAGKELLRSLLPILFSSDNDMVVGVTSVTLGRGLHNDDGRLQGTLCLNMDGNIHLPVLFALLQDNKEIESLRFELFTSDRISFYRNGRTAVIV